MKNLSIMPFLQDGFLGILALCVLLRLLIFIVTINMNPSWFDVKNLSVDGYEYHRLGLAILKDGRFGYESEVKPQVWYRSGELESSRTPLYPLLISVVYGIFGVDGKNVILTQILLDTLSCFFLMLSTRQIFNRRAAELTGILYALDLQVVFSAFTYYSETFLMFGLSVCFYFLTKVFATTVQPRKTYAMSIGLGATLGLSSLIKPITQILLVLVLIFSFLERTDRRLCIARTLVIFISFLVVVSPWIYRNYKEFGYPQLSSTGSCYFLYTVSPMEAKKHRCKTIEAWQMLWNESEENIRRKGLNPDSLSLFQKGRYLNELAMSYIAEFPRDYVLSFLTGIRDMYLELGISGYLIMFNYPTLQIDIKALSLKEVFYQFFNRPPVSLVIALWILLVMLTEYVSFMLGLVESFKEKEQRRIVLFSAVALLLLMFVVGSGGNSRYKMHQIPFYLPIAGAGLSRILQSVQKQK